MIMKRSLLFALLCWIVSSVAFALEQVEGVYQIGTAQDLVAFSNMVASGNGSISGALTADIDMTDVTFTPIGSTNSKFTGEFNGQEHSIKNLNLELEDQEYVGLFGVIGGGAYIHDVVIAKSCKIKGKAFVGGIAGGTNGGGTATFERCGNEATITAIEQNAAGICGVSMGSQCGIVILNCFNTAGIVANREAAAFCGWVGDNGSRIENCYQAGYVIGQDGQYSLWRNTRGKGLNNFDIAGAQGTKISEDEYDMECGAVCYQLNGSQSDAPIWFQTIDKDLHPYPFASRGVVYAVGDLYCDGTPKDENNVSFSNTNESNRDPHSFEDGVCVNCGAADKNYKELTEDGFYLLETAKDLNWFAALVNNGNKKVKARLTADIDFTGYTQDDVMIGGDAFSAEEEDPVRAFNGVFDGAGHTITIDYAASYDGVALFKVVESSTIKNLMVKGSIETSNRFAGGLMFVTRGNSTFENIVVDVDINGSYVGDATHGGICAVAHETPTFSNCAFIGSMVAEGCEGSAAIIGYAHGEVETIIKNCYVAPSELLLANGSTVIARHVKTKKNCFYTDNVISVSDNSVEIISEDLLATGELCYLLNAADGIDAWRQDLGTDNYPVPFADHKMVYAAGSESCDGTLKPDVTYTNTETGVTRDEHNYENDICTVCGARIIRNATQLEALANAINSGEIDGKVIVDVVEDIDMSEIEDFTGIGTRTTELTGEVDEQQNPITRDVKRPFSGIFDGHGHKISHMNIDVQTGNAGLFGLASGATIKNIIVDESCDIWSTGYSAGIVGTACGNGTLTIENCGNEATVNVGPDGANGAGILGVNDLSEAYVRIINCYNTGTITGQRECGAISGWLGDVGEVVNSWNSGYVNPSAIDGDRSFARFNGSNVKLVNCYEVEGTQVNQVTLDDVESGKLCFLLNKDAEAPIFFQTLGTDAYPVFDNTHAVVYETVDGGYSNDASASGIETSVVSKKSGIQVVYSLSGARQMQLQRGINIVRMADGSVKKIMK